MGIFGKITRQVRRNFERRAGAEVDMNTLDLIAAGGETAVSSERSSGHAVAYRCIQARAEAIASLPLRVYEKTADGSKSEVLDHPLNRVLCGAFTPHMNAFEGREAMSAWADIWGNSYFKIVANGRGEITGLTPMLPGCVSVERLASGRIRYRWTDPNGRIHALLDDEVLHVRHRANDGITGLSPLQVARDTMGLALDQITTARSQAKKSFRPEGALVFPQNIAADQKQAILDKLATKFESDAASSRVLVLDGGATWNPLAFNAKDMEFIESRRLTNLEIARLYGVPPTIAGITDDATYSNVTQENRSFVARCVGPWAKRIEASYTAALLTERERVRLTIQHDLNGMLRGDLEARFEAYRIARDGGWMSANDIRRAEDAPTIEDGDHYLRPLNMARSDEVTD